MTEDGNAFDLRPLEPHERIMGLPEVVQVVLVCEQAGQVVGYVYSTVYGWTHNLEVEEPDSTPETWAHWQTHRAAVDQLVAVLYEQSVYEANHILDDCPEDLNYTYLLASYMNFVMRCAGKSYLESGRVPDLFDEVEWQALQIAAQQATAWGLEGDNLWYEPQTVERSN